MLTSRYRDLLNLLQGIEQKKPGMIGMGTESGLLASRSAKLPINLHSPFVTSQHAGLYFRGKILRCWELPYQRELLKQHGVESRERHVRKPQQIRHFIGYIFVRYNLEQRNRV